MGRRNEGEAHGMEASLKSVTAALGTLRVGAADSEERLHEQAAEAFARKRRTRFGLHRNVELISWWAASAWRSRKKGRSARR